MPDKIVVFSTCGSAEEAGTLARGLIETRVPAPVNVFPQIPGYYRWEREIQSAEESGLMIKTSPNYLEWLTKELRQ